jgi:hypothetical protein
MSPDAEGSNTQQVLPTINLGLKERVRSKWSEAVRYEWMPLSRFRVGEPFGSRVVTTRPNNVASIVEIPDRERGFGLRVPAADARVRKAKRLLACLVAWLQSLKVRSFLAEAPLFRLRYYGVSSPLL